MSLGRTCLLFRPEGKLIGNIRVKAGRADYVCAGRQENVVLFSYIDYGAHIKPKMELIVSVGCGPVEKLRPETKILIQVTLNQPSQKPQVLMRMAGIYQVAASAIRQPWPPTFLKPDGQEHLGITVSKSP